MGGHHIRTDVVTSMECERPLMAPLLVARPSPRGHDKCVLVVSFLNRERTLIVGYSQVALGQQTKALSRAGGKR